MLSLDAGGAGLAWHDKEHLVPFTEFFPVPQFVRNWLTSDASGWDKESGEHPPPLPDDVVAKTREAYVEAYERLTGKTFRSVRDDSPA